MTVSYEEGVRDLRTVGSSRSFLDGLISFSIETVEAHDRSSLVIAPHPDTIAILKNFGPSKPRIRFLWTALSHSGPNKTLNALTDNGEPIRIYGMPPTWEAAHALRMNNVFTSDYLFQDGEVALSRAESISPRHNIGKLISLTMLTGEDGQRHVILSDARPTETTPQP